MPFRGTINSARLTASGQARTGAGVCLGFSYSCTTTAGQIRLYDGVAGGTIKCQISPQAALGVETLHVPIRFHFQTGLYVDFSGGVTRVNPIWS